MCFSHTGIIYTFFCDSFDFNFNFIFFFVLLYDSIIVSVIRQYGSIQSPICGKATQQCTDNHSCATPSSLRHPEFNPTRPDCASPALASCAQRRRQRFSYLTVHHISLKCNTPQSCKKDFGSHPKNAGLDVYIFIYVYMYTVYV